MRNPGQRAAVACLLLAAVLGCDSNPDSPSAPTKPNPGAGNQPAPTEPGVMPRKAAPDQPVTSPQAGVP